MISELMSKVRFLVHRKPMADVDEELRAHMEASIAAKVAAGMPEAEARRRAVLEFGGVEAVREQCHEQRPGAFFDTLRQDVRYSVRILRRDAGFTAIAVLILALGIGANVVVFSLVNTILLRPLPFDEPQRLTWIAPLDDHRGLSSSTYSADAYDDLRDMNTTFSGVTGYYAFSSPDNVKLTGQGIPQPATSMNVVGNFFKVLGVRPELGRDFTVAEAQKGASPVALLSYAFWKQRYQGDRGIVGKAISANGAPLTVVGVLPESFDFGAIFAPGSKVDMFSPVALDDIRMQGNTLTLMGRLKPGVTLRQAQAEAKVLFPQFYWGKRIPKSKGAYGPAEPILMKEHVAGELRRSLHVLWAAVGLILLIVCVNLSNLLISRAATRSKEFALRVALGAGRGRLVRQLLTESAILSGLGAMLGLVIAFAVTFWIAHQSSVALPLLSSLRVDWHVMAWTLLIAVVTSLAIGLAPGLKLTSGSLQATLKDTGPGTSDGRKHERLRTVLVVSEVALACVLIVGAGLLLRSFLRVLDVDLGFRASQAAALQLDVNDNLKIGPRTAFYQNVLNEVSRIPGIEAEGLSDNLPLQRNRSWGPPGVKGKDYPDNARPSPFIYVVSPGYLEAMGIQVRGRDFTWHDDLKSEYVMVLNKKAAEFLFPGEDAVGRMVDMQGKDTRIIGVAPDVHETEVEAGTGWQIYLPIAQDWGEAGAQLVVRSSLPVETLAPTLLSRIRTLNAAQPAVELRPLQQFVDHATSPRRFFALLVAVFAGLGLLLASLGIYGVISYAVTRQTQEIGIRMALGATQQSVLLKVIGRTLRLALVGIAIGTVVSFGVARGISSLLFGTEPTDPVTFVGMMGMLTVVAFVAGYLPARRASRISPMVALRSH